MIVTVAMLAAAMAGGWYREDIAGWVALRGWDRQAPLAAAEAYARAMEASDQAGVEAVAPGTALEMDGGTIAKMKPPGAPGQMAMQDPGVFTPALPLAAPQYRYRLNQRIVYVTLAAQAGGTVELAIDHREGKWRITRMAATR